VSQFCCFECKLKAEHWFPFELNLPALEPIQEGRPKKMRSIGGSIMHTQTKNTTKENTLVDQAIAEITAEQTERLRAECLKIIQEVFVGASKRVKSAVQKEIKRATKAIKS
jgi:hypothetical protein